MWWKRFAVGTMATAIAGGAALVAAPVHACACGALLVPAETDATVAAETAIISWDGHEERIILSLEVDSAASEAALLIPTPSPATVELADHGAFDELADITAPTVRRVDQWWPDWLMREDLDNSDVAQPGETTALPVDLAGIEVDVLDAANADDLEAWLEENEYTLRDDVAGALKPYIQQEWHFVLIRLDADSFTGRLQPLDIRFETNQVVYPMRLSIAGGPIRVRTYVFAEHRMERTDSMGGSLTWAGEVRPADFTGQTLVDLAVEHPFLTAWEQFFYDPRSQVDGDMAFAAASVDEPYEQVYTEVTHRELFGAPAGPTLVFIGLIIVGFGGGIFSMVRRKRRYRTQQ